MREILIGLGLCVLLFGSAFAIRSATMMQLLYAGGTLVALGLLFSTPFAVWYHVKLYRALKPRGVLGRGWVLNPTSYHSKLTDEERGGVMVWFYLGAAGWVVSVLGLVALGLSIWVGRSE